MRNIIRLCVVLVFMILSAYSVLAQMSRVYDDPDAAFRSALDLFEKEKFGAAQTAFIVLADDEAAGPEIRSSASFYDAMCAAELNHPDATQKISGFLTDYPEDGRAKTANFYLGKMYFNNNKFRDALKAFKKVRPNDLDKDALQEYNFKIGYSYLKSNEPDRAKQYFRKLLNSKSKYSSSASYYYAHINYLEGNYAEALPNFEKLATDRTYKKVVPHYIIQINYQLGDYDKILATGPALVEASSGKRRAEVARLVGDAYYRDQQFREAIPYLEIYETTSRTSLSREDNYQLAYSYYQTGEYKNAIDNFQKVIKVSDSLSQNAFYHLGACYLETGDMKYAGNAFLSAYKNNFDKTIAEDALFNYARIAIQTTFNPYNEAIALIEEYIENNQNSARLEEAYGYLVNLYLSSKNYKQALASIENISNKTPELKQAYQQIAFFRAIELFNANELEEAIALFKSATSYDYIPEYTAEANYWIGEAFYRQKNYWGAVKYYKLFKDAKEAKALPMYQDVFYNLGYAQFQRKEYSKAISNFKSFVSSNNAHDLKLVNDAYIRTGDAYFIRKDYQSAITQYNNALKINKVSSDYALFQKASSEGALGNYRKKIETLGVLKNNYPSSAYHDDALYDIATSYLIINDENRALDHFRQLINQHPNSSLAVKSLNRSGLIYYNRNQFQQSVESFKQVVERYPGTPEAKEALDNLQNVYIDMNQVDQYYEYVKGISFADVSTYEQDSVTYMAAENRYMEGKCDLATSGFQSYLQQFPQGLYTANALFYKAECDMKAGKSEEALSGYLQVSEQAFSRFTETSLLKASAIEFEKDEFEKALLLYEKLAELAEYPQNHLIALEGILRCQTSLGNNHGIIDAGKNLLTTDNVPNELINEAHINMARAYYASNDLDMARFEYNITRNLVQNEWAAEAQYFLADISFRSGKYTEAEEYIFELAEKYSSYDYWVARGFILLADVYVEMDNIFQARQTLQSIIDNYQGDDLKSLAQEKLVLLAEKEEIPQNENNQNNPNEF